MVEESNQDPMPTKVRRLVGTAHVVIGALSLAAFVAAYGLAEHLVALQESAPEGSGAVSVPVLAGTVTLNVSVLLLGAAAGVVGSAIQQSIVFANRSGWGTLGAGWTWWYALRPLWSAQLGGVFVLAVNAGLVSIGDQTTSTAGVTVLAIMGCVAGLFTDQVLEKLGKLLGASPTTKFARGAANQPDVATA